VKRARFGIVALSAFAVALAAAHLRSTPYNNYVLLADAFLHARVWIVWPGPYIDALAYAGHRYVIEGPLPAILLLPYVAAAGLAANQTLVAAALAGIAVAVAWSIGERLGLSIARNAWLCAFLLLGTALQWCAMLGDVWFIAHVSAVCFTLLALDELLGNRRGWLVALWAVCAAESRMSLVLALPVYAVLLSAMEQQPESFTFDRRGSPKRLLGFGSVLAVAAVLWGAYNFARWGTLGDIGYTTWYQHDSAGMTSGSPFRLLYLPYELSSFFVQWPDFAGAFPWIRPSIAGVALTWTSPALLFALWARRPRAFVVALWCAAILTAIPSFLYYVNGFAQYGMRHALDFIPFLFVLMALAARERLPLWAKVLIVYSCVAGVYGVWYWDAFIRPAY